MDVVRFTTQRYVFDDFVCRLLCVVYLSVEPCDFMCVCMFLCGWGLCLVACLCVACGSYRMIVAAIVRHID